jgi:hypothetical protein
MTFSPTKGLSLVVQLMPSNRTARSRWTALCSALLFGSLLPLSASGRPAMAGSIAIDTNPERRRLLRRPSGRGAWAYTQGEGILRRPCTPPYTP